MLETFFYIDIPGDSFDSGEIYSSIQAKELNQGLKLLGLFIISFMSEGALDLFKA